MLNVFPFVSTLVSETRSLNLELTDSAADWPASSRVSSISTFSGLAFFSHEFWSSFQDCAESTSPAMPSPCSKVKL